MVRAALGGALDGVETVTDPLFGLEVPVRIEGISDRLLRPRDTWGDAAAYDQRAGKLAEMFAANFETFADDVSEEVRAAGPRALRAAGEE